MAEAKLGEQVEVDISGLEGAGVSIGGGIVATGEIVAIDVTNQEITVELGLSLGGRHTVTVPAERAKLLPDAGDPAGQAEVVATG